MARDLISIRDLSDAEIEALFGLADTYAGAARKRLSVARDVTLAALFYEPSTRTRMSFEAAMLRLGGHVISMADPHASSVAKGETLADTVRIVESYADIIALRHPGEGAARVAAHYASVPVINGGDGAREHPTQTLVDLYTILRAKGRLEGVRVALCGDLKHGRTVHSLAQGLARFGARAFCVSPPGLELPERLRKELEIHTGEQVASYTSLEEAPLGECDALYVTRIQKERFGDAAEYERLRTSYQVSRGTLTRLRADAIVLHPLPRVDELDFALDGDPRAAYFQQAAYGVPVRMALMAAMLELEGAKGVLTRRDDAAQGVEKPGFRCDNTRCVSHGERGLPGRECPTIARRCGWCDALQELP